MAGIRRSVKTGTNTHVYIDGYLMPKNAISVGVIDDMMFLKRGEEKIWDSVDPTNISNDDLGGGGTLFDDAGAAMTKMATLLLMPA